jgi:TPR repeat protein
MVVYFIIKVGFMKKFCSIIAIVAVAFTLTACVETLFNIARKGKQIGASEYLKTTALGGDAEAQYNLGKVYCCGDRPEYDNVEALRWWCMASENGQRDAMMEVGKLYETSHKFKGSIIPRNNVRAFVFYSQAVEHGNDDAKESMIRTEALLSKADKKHASYMMEQWPVVGCEITR